MSPASPVSTHINSLRGLIANLDSVISRVKESTGATLLGFTCDFLPFEVLSSFNIFPLVFPRSLSAQDTDSLLQTIDYTVKPETCCRPLGTADRDKLISISSIPGGYGEAAVSEWESLVEDVITRITGIPHPVPDAVQLSASAEKYNEIRRMVRGIAALRAEYPSLMSNAELGVVFEAALCLPRDILLEQLTLIRDALNAGSNHRPRPGIPALAYGGFSVKPELLDEIESAGFAIIEDDICCGRRSFDLSHDTSSTGLYAEILNAFSFRPFCPCLRDQASRFDLLYRLLGSYGIETVLLIGDEECPARAAQADYLRVKLMRSGIDPLVMSPRDAVAKASKYVELSSR
jgi:hypothetical protein